MILELRQPSSALNNLLQLCVVNYSLKLSSITPVNPFDSLGKLISLKKSLED